MNELISTLLSIASSVHIPARFYTIRLSGKRTERLLAYVGRKVYKRADNYWLKPREATFRFTDPKEFKTMMDIVMVKSFGCRIVITSLSSDFEHEEIWRNK